jgi:bacteriophage N4 adsorption protein A
MKLFSMLLLALAVSSTASAQPIDSANDLTGYTRFVVYPHLQQGWESMQRGDRTRALAELERARHLAPEVATVALHLAQAYQKFGDVERAESLLREQIKLTPGDARLLPALMAVRAGMPTPAAPATASACIDRVGVSCEEVPPATDRRASGRSTRASSSAGHSALAPVASRPQPAHDPGSVPPSPARVPQFADTAQLGADFTLALQAHQFDDAQRQADTWLAHDVSGSGLLDTLTYQLVTAGATEQALRVLLRTYPFANHAAAERDTLFQRLILLIDQQPGVIVDDRLLPLREPLDTPALRSRQAVLWARFEDCGAVRAVLGDMSPEYGYDDWMRLGDCSAAENPALAEQAYTKAHTLQPGGRASRALGYHAHATGDFGLAVDAWRSVGPENLSGDDLLAAVTTAVAAGATDQAVSWLETYRRRGDTLSHRYWSLVADSTLRTDPSAAAAALARAIELQPEADDYLRLALVEQDAARQVHWLERAAALDPGNSTTHAQLGYAYTRGGWPASAVDSFERAAALAPADIAMQRELGYAYWRAGRAADAQRVLEPAWHADPTNQQLAKQLVYVHQRLKHNDEARAYAERVLDASSSEASAKDPAAADQRFNFQRLHEDLGRRVTISADAWSGTHVGTGASAPQAGSHYRSYSQFEADIRLGNPPIRDGATLSAYVRVIADSGDLGTALPSQNPLLGIGLRWKPLRNHVIYLAAESQNGLEDRSRRDVLLRASASFLNGGRAGDDWHPSGSGWFSRNLYFDAADYVQSNYRAFTADYRTSYHRKLSTAQTLEPYGHLQFNGVDNSEFQRDTRGGVGVRWNFWHGATQYDAVPHKLSIGIEFQQAFETYLPDRNGVFLTFGTRW